MVEVRNQMKEEIRDARQEIDELKKEIYEIKNGVMKLKRSGCSQVVKVSDVILH